MADTQKPTLRQSFEQLPTKVREWLASEEATFIIIELNQRLGLEGVLIEVVPNAITRLVTKNLGPKEFINDISDGLGVEWIVAQGIAQEIERRILRPVEISLRNEAGVDIKAIFLAKPPATLNPITTPVNPAMPPIYRPAPPPPAQSTPMPLTPPVPSTPVPATPKEIPVKINVQKSPADQPFGADSWVNKIK